MAQLIIEFNGSEEAIDCLHGLITDGGIDDTISEALSMHNYQLIGFKHEGDTLTAEVKENQ